jgi:DNA-binding CsgD family transcriptional regulator
MRTSPRSEHEMGDDLTAEEWFGELIKAGEDDPDSVTDELLLDLTEQLYVRMTELGLRPMELAERLGVSRAYVSQLLNGKPNMTIRTLVRWALALDARIHVELRSEPPPTGNHQRDGGQLANPLRPVDA